MKEKMASAIMLTLLLTGMLALAFNIKPAKASGTIYIRADGSVDPPTAPISTADNVTYTFTGDIYDAIVVERDNIAVDGAGYTATGSGSGNGTTLTGRSNVTVRNMTTRNFAYGISLSSSSNNTVSGNNVTANNGDGIRLYHSSNNTLSGNNAANNYAGISLSYGCSNNTVSGNNAANNGDGIRLYSSNNNTLSGNNFTANNGNGIVLNDHSYHNTLSGNNIANNGDGIWLSYFCCYNVLSGNNVTANIYDGIWLCQSVNNTLSGNNIANNGDGIWLYLSSDNTLSGNNVTASNYYGIWLDLTSNNTLSGNVMGGNRYNFGVEGSTLSSYLQSVDTSNLVDGKPVYYFMNQSDIVVNADAYPQVGYLGFVNCANVTVQGLNLTSNFQGLLLVSTNNSRITNNNIASNWAGIWVYSCCNNTLSGNNVTASNYYGIWLDHYSYNNVFHHNNFINNTQQVYIGLGSSWDDGYLSGGNYWSDYNGIDLYRGPHQNEIGSDGIGDTPYVIGKYDQDDYPLMKPYPWDPHDVGTTSVRTSRNIVGQGFNVSINASVFNYGDSTEDFNVTIYANSTAICEIDNIELASRNSTTINFTWDTAGFAMGNYTMTVYVTPVSGETDTTDNNSTVGWVLVTILGDVDGDFEDGHYDVDLFDAVKLLAYYGAKIGDSNYDPNCDIDNDGQVFLFDAVMLLGQYGQKYP
jgi:parallel beta-helix repeat protein